MRQKHHLEKDECGEKERTEESLGEERDQSGANQDLMFAGILLVTTKHSKIQLRISAMIGVYACVPLSQC